MKDTLLNECLNHAYNCMIMDNDTNIMGYFFERDKQIGCSEKNKTVVSLGNCPISINFKYDTIECIDNGSQGMICFERKDGYGFVVTVPRDEAFILLKEGD